jgi:hypothetical protein
MKLQNRHTYLAIGVVLGLMAAVLTISMLAPSSAVQAGISAPTPIASVLFSYETGVQGWTGTVVASNNGGTVAITTSHVTEGSQALQINPDANGGWFSRQQGELDFTGWSNLVFDIYTPVPTTVTLALQSGGWTWQETGVYTLTTGDNTVAVNLETGFNSNGGRLSDPTKVQAIHINYQPGATYVQDNVRLRDYTPPPTSTSTPTIGATPTPIASLPGFRVIGRHLYDYCGEKVLLRGINKMVIWTDINGNSFPEIAKTGANSVRIVWLPSGSAAQLDAVVQRAIDNGLIPMVGLWNTTGDWGQLTQALEFWLRPDIIAVVQKYEKYFLLNVGNEPGDASITVDQFKDTYRYIILRLRQAGVHVPIVIDGSDWGKSIDTLQAAGPYLMAADPDHNLIFDVHPYWPYKWSHSDAEIVTQFEETVALGLPLILGEFGNKWDNDGSVGDEIPYRLMIEEAYWKEFGYYPWEWGPGNNPQTHLNMTDDSTYDTLHDWGLEVAVTSTFSILNTSTRPYSLLHDECASDVTPAPQPSPTPYNDYPSVSITAPEFNAMLPVPANTVVSAEAFDRDGTVTKVEFFANGLKFGEDATAPYTATFKTAITGEFWLTARATDNMGAAAWSMGQYVIVGTPAHFSVNNTITTDISNTLSDTLKFYYQGNWGLGVSSGRFHDDDQYSPNTGDSFQFSFHGTQIEMYSSKAPHHGIAGISVDGGPQQTADLYSPVSLNDVLAWTSDELTLGDHTIVVTVTGQSNAEASGHTVSVDRVRITTGETSEYRVIQLPFLPKNANPVSTPYPTATPKPPTPTPDPTVTLIAPTRTAYPTSTPTLTPTPSPTTTGVPYTLIYSFETDAEGWSGAGTVVVTTTHATHYTHALQINSTGGWLGSTSGLPKDFTGKAYLKFDVYSPSNQSVKVAIQSGSWTWQETADKPIHAGMNTIWVDLSTIGGTGLADPTNVQKINVYYNAGTFVQDFFRLEDATTTLLPGAEMLYSFETDVQGWSGSGTVAVTTTHVTEGAQALQVNSTGGWAGSTSGLPKDFTGKAYLKFDIYSPSNQSVKVATQSGSWTWQETADMNIPAGMSTVWVDLSTIGGTGLADPTNVQKINVYFNALTFVVDFFRLE